jgi:sigma-E factor negative regulatory protein RseA
MTDERPNERATERQAERDSQLSAMFDGELPAAECELLARRLSRDEALRAQWSRFALIGAALRAERGVVLHDRVAWRVQTAIAQETTYGEGIAVDGGSRQSAASASTGRSARSWSHLAWPAAGASIAAGVAAVSIFWLRGMQEPVEMLQAATTAPQSIVLTPEPAGATVAPADATLAMSDASAGPGDSRGSGEPGAYSTPTPSDSTVIAPPARLANYVVAHSEYSGPLSRRMALLGIVGAESGEGNAEPAPAERVTEGADAN